MDAMVLEWFESFGDIPFTAELGAELNVMLDQANIFAAIGRLDLSSAVVEGIRAEFLNLYLPEDADVDTRILFQEVKEVLFKPVTQPNGRRVFEDAEVIVEDEDVLEIDIDDLVAASKKDVN